MISKCEEMRRGREKKKKGRVLLFMWLGKVFICVGLCVVGITIYRLGVERAKRKGGGGVLFATQGVFIPVYFLIS